MDAEDNDRVIFIGDNDEKVEIKLKNFDIKTLFIRKVQ